MVAFIALDGKPGGRPPNRPSETFTPRDDACSRSPNMCLVHKTMTGQAVVHTIPAAAA
jgi:hypothetical protein